GAEESLRGDLDACLERYYARASAALKGVVQVADPDEIVLGGGLSKLPRLTEELERRLPKAIFNATGTQGDGALPSVRVRLAQFGDDAGVRGAALFAAASSSSRSSS
ncbi:MAG: ROK family protein, partial [Planctomycetes bacterium]|nr:ROK family protein [Planctomycetota bacterium]